MDVAPLRNKPVFRRLWLGTSVSALGSQMTNYAVLLQAFLFTKSSLDVGLVGLFIAVPTVVVGLFGGGLIDAVDRKVILFTATIAQAAVSLGLFLQALLGMHELVVLYALVGLGAGVGALNNPARRAVITSLLDDDELAAGAALQSFSGNGSLLIGPALAGVLTAVVGLKACYLLDVASFSFALYGAAGLSRMLPSGAELGRKKAVRAGISFVLGEKVLFGAFLLDMSATFLGMPVALFPAINAQRFGGDAQTLGLFTTALAAGGILASLASGPVVRIRRQGAGMVIAASVWGIGLLGFGLAHGLVATLLFLALAGAGDVSSVVLRTALVQAVTPDELRGRVSSLDFAVGAGVPQLGSLRAGAVASLSSAQVAAVSGGITSVLGVGLVAGLVPGLLGFRLRRGATAPVAPVVLLGEGES